MANKLKDFLFPSKDSNELDSSTIVINKDEQINDNVRKSTNNNLTSSSPQIITPKVFSQVENISNQILNGHSVIVDLTSTDLSEAKRICDFLNGVTFAINGKVEKIARLVYLFAPKKS